MTEVPWAARLPQTSSSKATRPDEKIPAIGGQAAESIDNMTDRNSIPKPLTADEVIMPEERRFQVGERELVVRPLVIGDYKRISADLGAIAQRVAREHPEIDLAKPDEHLEAIFPILGEAIGRLFQRLFGIEESYLDEHLTLAQAAQIVTAALEVNQLPEIRKNVGRALQLAKTTPS